MTQTVLVIEDNKDIAELVALHLRDAGFAVTLAEDGARGLALARGGNFDALVLDLMLPGSDGLSICRELRQQESYLPILMLTAKSSELDRVLGSASASGWHGCRHCCVGRRHWSRRRQRPARALR